MSPQNLCQALWPQTTSFLGQKASIHCSWLLVPMFGWLRSKQWYTHALDLQAFRASADQVNLGYWRILKVWVETCLGESGGNVLTQLWSKLLNLHVLERYGWTNQQQTMKHHETLPPNRTEWIGSQFPAKTRNINITVERFFKRENEL